MRGRLPAGADQREHVHVLLRPDAARAAHTFTSSPAATLTAAAVSFVASTLCPAPFAAAPIIAAALAAATAFASSTLIAATFVAATLAAATHGGRVGPLRLVQLLHRPGEEHAADDVVPARRHQPGRVRQPVLPGGKLPRL